jgi:hypothetical protein
MKNTIRLSLLLVLGFLLVAPIQADLGTKRANPHRRKAGESFPPLPLPATPLRRTEKKRPPAPPVLIGRIAYGVPRELVVGGTRHTFFDWKSDPAALRTLLFRCRKRLKVEYRDKNLKLKHLSGNPDELPILYIVGHIGFDFPEKELTMLRDYLRRGGFLWSEACCGDPRFTESAIKVFAKLFPDRPLKRLPLDHPIYKSYRHITELNYSPACPAAKGPPVLYGVDLGCRTAIIHSPYDLGCGWEGHAHEGAKAFGIDDANILGVNMVAYCLAYHKLGEYLSVRKIYHQQDDTPAGSFVFGQLRLSADTDPDPSGPISLLKEMANTTSGKVAFRRFMVDPATDDLLDTPFLYFTGHDDFVLSDAAVRNLRGYLAGGGFLFADACCGRVAFSAAFEREIARVLPGASLQTLPLDHALYGTHHAIREVAYSRAVEAAYPGLSAPHLKGIEVDGSLRVVLSPMGLGCSWGGVERPFAKFVAHADSLRIGVNIVVYAMTH